MCYWQLHVVLRKYSDDVESVQNSIVKLLAIPANFLFYFMELYVSSTPKNIKG